MQELLQPVTARFSAAGFPVFLVGGSVRNELLGLPASDLDICGPARPEQVLSLFEGSGMRVVPRAVHFGTVEIHFEWRGKRHMAEYTTFRRDSYRCGHRPDSVQFTDRIEVDALRRDFRVNALYRDLASGKLIDPTGGLSDIEKKRLRTVTDDPALVLRDDGLRILRMARFAAQLRFSVDEKLLRCAKEHAPLLMDIAPERIREEWEKILLSDLRYPQLPGGVEGSVGRGLSLLEQTGAYCAFFTGCARDADTVLALANLFSTNAVFTIAAECGADFLLGDFGENTNVLALRSAAFFGRTNPVILKNALVSLRFSTEIVRKTAIFVENLWDTVDNSFSRQTLARMGYAQGAALACLLLARGCPQEARAVFSTLAALKREKAPMDVRGLSVSGNDLLPLLEGRDKRIMTPLLEALRVHCVDDPRENEREKLLLYAKKYLRDFVPQTR